MKGGVRGLHPGAARQQAGGHGPPREHIAGLLQAAEFISPTRLEAPSSEGVARLALVGENRYVWVGGTTPLNAAGLAVAQGFVRPGARGLLNPLLCAEAAGRRVLTGAFGQGHGAGLGFEYTPGVGHDD